MKKFFAEFGKFISRGNVLDLAVGVIIGGAFTAIVTALTTHILQPLINGLIFLATGSKSIQNVYTFIVGSADNLENAIYINWGAFISAVINFILVGFILFVIVRMFNRVKEKKENLSKDLYYAKLRKATKEDKKKMAELGIDKKDKVAVKKYLDDKVNAVIEAEKLAEEQKKAEEEEAKKHTTEALLEDIKVLLEKKVK